MVLQVLQVSETSKLSVNVAGGLGFTAIIIAWLSKLNPVVMIVASFCYVMSKNRFRYQNISQPPQMIQVSYVCVLRRILLTTR